MKKAHSVSPSSIWFTEEVHSQDMLSGCRLFEPQLLAKKQDGEGELEEQSLTQFLFKISLNGWCII